MIHVAVLMKPYLDLVLEGRKTVECRLTRQPRPPFERIETGDRIYFKQSAGSYRATAIADHVLFERDLTPGRVAQLKRDYNDRILGDDQFWTWKHDSRYATLIWLRDVQPIETGPAIRPLQGLAWLALNERAATSEAVAATTQAELKPTPALDGRCFSVTITEGNLRNNTLYVSTVLDRFPDWTIGGPTRRQAARPVTIMLDDGLCIETDIVGPRKLLRSRQWGTWFRAVDARPGDCVIFTPAAEGTYFAGLARAQSRAIAGSPP